MFCTVFTVISLLMTTMALGILFELSDFTIFSATISNRKAVGSVAETASINQLVRLITLSTSRGAGAVSTVSTAGSNSDEQFSDSKVEIG